MQNSSGDGRETPVLRGLGAAGLVLIAVGIGMALMPFVGPPLGLPFDGEQALVLDRNRLLLHVFPGLVGAAAGFGLWYAQRRRVRDGRGYPDWLKPAIAVAVSVGIWSAIGPWAMEALMPAGSTSSLMFQAIPSFGGLSSADQLLLQFICHWLPGVLALGAAWVALSQVRRLSPSGRAAAT